MLTNVIGYLYWVIVYTYNEEYIIDDTRTVIDMYNKYIEDLEAGIEEEVDYLESLKTYIAGKVNAPTTLTYFDTEDLLWPSTEYTIYFAF